MEKYRTTLPAGYREVDVIDIKNDKRVRVWGDILSVLLMAATAGVGCFAVPLAELIHFDYTDMAALLSVLLRLIAAGLGGVAVIVLTCLLAAGDPPGSRWRPPWGAGCTGLPVGGHGLGCGKEACSS